jgi:hypothetical protein
MATASIEPPPNIYIQSRIFINTYEMKSHPLLLPNHIYLNRQMIAMIMASPLLGNIVCSVIASLGSIRQIYGLRFSVAALVSKFGYVYLDIQCKCLVRHI